MADGKERKSSDAIGGFEIRQQERLGRAVVRNPKEYLVTSETVLIGHPRHGHVYNHVKVKIGESGEVEITARYLKPDKLEILMDEKFVGSLGKSGIDFFVKR